MEKPRRPCDRGEPISGCSRQQPPGCLVLLPGEELLSSREACFKPCDDNIKRHSDRSAGRKLLFALVGQFIPSSFGASVNVKAGNQAIKQPCPVGWR